MTIAPDATLAAKGVVRLAQDLAGTADKIMVPGLWTPADQAPGCLGWTIDPADATANKAPTLGVLYCTKGKAVPGKTITTVSGYLSTVGNGASNTYWGFFDQTGAQLAVTSDRSTSYNGGSGRLISETAFTPFTVPADGIVICALLVGAATTATPAFTAYSNGTATVQAALMDGSKGYRAFTYGTGLTAMPASLALNSTNCASQGQRIALLFS